MADWETIPAFANGDVMRADTIQQMWQNLQTLKNANYVESQLVNTDTNSWSTTNTNFADVDTTKLRHSFESYGGDLMAGVLIKWGHTNVGGSLLAQFQLDGTAYGNAGGAVRLQKVNLVVSSWMLYIFEDVPAGDHIMDVQFATLTSGTATYYEDSGNKFWVREF